MHKNVIIMLFLYSSILYTMYNVHFKYIYSNEGKYICILKWGEGDICSVSPQHSTNKLRDSYTLFQFHLLIVGKKSPPIGAVEITVNGHRFILTWQFFYKKAEEGDCFFDRQHATKR